MDKNAVIIPAQLLECNDSYEPNNSKGSAFRFQMSLVSNPPMNIHALIDTKSDVDWFHFEILGGSSTATGSVIVKLEELPGDYDVYLYDEAGNQIGVSANSGTADETLNYDNTSGNNEYYYYYVCVVPKVWAGFNGQKISDPSNCYSLTFFAL